MKPSLKILLFVLLLPFPCLLCAPRASGDPAEDYKQTARRLTVVERLELAKETIETSENEALLGEAAWDLAKFALTPERGKAALTAVESLIVRSPEASELSCRANLAKARILLRLGKKDESIAMFKRALAERRYKFAYREYQESMLENGERELAAIEEYNLRASSQFSDENLAFHRVYPDLLDMLYALKVMKAADPGTSAIDSVFPQLKESSRRPLAKQVAKALCLAVDGRYEESITQLNNIEKVPTFGKPLGSRYDESKDLPLYLAAVLFCEGQHFDAMRAAFRAYMDRNEGNREKVLKRALKLMYAMENRHEDARKIGELAEFLVKSEYVTDQAIRDELPEGNVASLLNMYRRGLWWQNRLDEAKGVALQIMEQYYPQTLASGDAVNLGLYSIYLHQDKDAAERLLNDILENAPYDEIVPHVKACLAGLAAQRGDNGTALSLSQDVLDRFAPASRQGPIMRCRESMLRLRELIDRGKTWQPAGNR